MFSLIQSGKLQEPIYTPEQAQPGTSNKDFVAQYTMTLLQQAFQNLKEIQIKQFVDGLFTLNDDFNKFKVHLRDFLISLKEFAGDNAELYAEEREQEQQNAKLAERERGLKVGGLIKPHDLDQDDEL